MLVKLAKDSDDASLRESVEERLLKLVEDPLIRTRSAAIGGLGDLRVESARSLLESLAEDSAVSRLRRSARTALEKLEPLD